MKEMALRSRIAVLVVATLLSVNSAEAASPYTCSKIGTTYCCQR
jgi:hypothetical protein